MHITKQKKPIEKASYCKDNCRTFQKRQIYGETKMISGCQGDGGMNRQSTEVTQSSETTLYDTIIATHVITNLSEPIEYITPRMNLM